MLLQWILHFCTQTLSWVWVRRHYQSMYSVRTCLFCSSISSEVIRNGRHGGLVWFFFFQFLAVHNHILFHILWIIYFCFLPERKGRFQAIWDRFGFSPRSKWNQLPKTPNVAADWKYHMRHGPRNGMHHSWVFSEICCLGVSMQNCHVWWGRSNNEISTILTLKMHSRSWDSNEMFCWFLWFWTPKRN